MAANAKVVLVTGAGSRRIGSSIAAAFAERGYCVGVHYHRSGAEAAAGIERLRHGGAAQAAMFQADLGAESDVERLAAEVLDSFKRIDVLVTAHGVWPALKLENTRSAEVLRQFAVNTLGTFLCCRQFGLRMAAQPEGGAIITLGDWATERPYLDYAAYFISKGAIPTLTRVLAVELAARNPAVRVNCIVPGPVMPAGELDAQEREESRAATLVQHWGRPQNVAHAAVFLAENDFVTGSCVLVDGGRSISPR